MNWEYKITDAKNHLLFLDAATQAGAQRWELLHVEFINGHVIGFFKRPAEKQK